MKKDKIVLKLQKVKGEYSYEHWSSLTAKKKREEAGSDNTPHGRAVRMSETTNKRVSKKYQCGSL